MILKGIFGIVISQNVDNVTSTFPNFDNTCVAAMFHTVALPHLPVHVAISVYNWHQWCDEVDMTLQSDVVP